MKLWFDDHQGFCRECEVINPSTTTGRHVLQAISGHSAYSAMEDSVWLQAKTKAVHIDRPLDSLDLKDGDTVHVHYRLRGGAGGLEIELHIKTIFGCWYCFDKMFCEPCSLCVEGRKYTVTVRKVDTAAEIIEQLKKQNPRVERGNLTFGQTKLDLDKKILYYKIENGAELIFSTAVKHVFHKEMRKHSKDDSDDESDMQEKAAEVRKRGADVAVEDAAAEQVQAQEQVEAQKDDNTAAAV